MTAAAVLQPRSPRVSALVSVLNGERYLRPAIESVLGQTLSDLELVVINNGSTDASAAILQSYAGDPRLIVVHNHTTVTYPQAINQGLKLCRGAFVARLDADDVALPNRFEIQARLLTEAPEVALVFSGYDLIDSSGAVFFSTSVPTEPGAIVDALPCDNPFPHSSFMFRRQMVAALGGYREQLIYAEDFALILDCCRVYRLGAAPEVLVQIRRHDAQLTFAPDYQEPRVRETCQLLAEARTLPGVSPAALARSRRTMAMAHLAWARTLARAGRRRAALGHWARAALWHGPATAGRMIADWRAAAPGALSALARTGGR